MILEINPFHLYYLVCWLLSIDSIPLTLFISVRFDNNVSTFTSDFSYLHPLFSEVIIAKDLSNFSNNQILILLVLLYSIVHSIYLCSILYYFLPSASFRFSLHFFFSFFE